MKLNIDGNDIEAREGVSVLEASLEAGIYIPHLCKHPDLEAIGGCRLCVVEIEGQDEIVPSCKMNATEGMIIKTNSEKASETRKMAMELILATHPADCTGCPKYGNCELQSIYQYLGVSPDGWKMKSRIVPNNTSNPLIDHSFTRCIRCGRCIRACHELRGVKVLDFRRTKDGIRVGTKDDLSLEEAGCKFCGACIEVCPTGAITDKLNSKNEMFSTTEAIVPCRSACPAHTDVPRYVRYIKEGEFAKATAVIREKVPFPEILGSICNHVCEDHCKRTDLKNPISICKLKKAASTKEDNNWKERAFHSEATGKKVAIVGAGPAGMTSAYFLAKKGYDVTVYEANKKAGGQCRYGIPSYRLSDEIVDREINGILEEGVKLELNTKIENPKDLLNNGFDAVLLSIGTHKGNRLPIEGNSLKGTFTNADFLKKVRENDNLDIKNRVIVLGGGNVAFDCARSAIRLGATEVHIACLESFENMTATKEEIEEGIEEGIILHNSNTFLKIIGTEKVEGIEIQKVKKFSFDDQGKAILELEENSNEIIPIDTVIFAVGQKPEGTENMDLELVRNSYIKTNDKLETNISGIFAAGDVVYGTKSVIEAIESGRKSAQSIDLYLGGNGDISENLVDKEIPNPFIGTHPNFSSLERVKIEILETDERKNCFAMVEKVLGDEKASCEASRCLQCDLRLQLTKPKLWNEFREVKTNE
ncbi:MAG: FAD-dependent oxidoreductase [Fusobacteriaceae bacterium]|nr:FAD-dependent oxidoreductase [Fusobacteriaceae bacterium]MBN2838446.1 FAD-dependent oxidoreductase [Fusobacteriaceae bacterium]